MSVTIDGTNGVTTPDVEVSSGGSASAPAITVTGDTNTGIFFPAADTIAFAEGGAERMRIDSSGNVGIGTSNPQKELHIASGQPEIRLEDTSGTVNYSEFIIADGRLILSSDAGNAIANSTIEFKVDNTERMRIDSSGNVGIGTDTPTRTLDVRGAFSVSAGNAPNDEEFLVTNDSSNNLVRLYARNRVDIAAIPMAFFTGTTERMRIDSSGNVGIGTSSPVFNDGSGLSIYNATAARLKLGDLTSGIGANDGLELIYDDNAYVYNRENTALIFGTNNTERARINNAGKFFVNATAELAGYSEQAVITANGTSVALALKSSDSSIALATTTTNTNTYNAAVFANNGNFSGALKGSISVSNTATTYNTTSDYRLKENIAPMTGALTTVARLKPCTYTWKDGGKTGQGFIAHELAEVVPDCVTGEKDAVETYTDEDGNEQTRPVYQGVDTSFLVATLTAAIQELKAINDAQASRIETLEAKVAALEANNV